jgi:hypothetical protein
MRPVAIGGTILLLLLILAAYVDARRSTAQGPSPASSPARGPPASALVLDPDDVDLGEVAPGEPRVVDVAWSWPGPGPLRVLSVETGCGCLVAEGLPATLPEGGAGVLSLRVAGRRHAGPYELGVSVRLEAEGVREQHVRLHGFVGSKPAVDPDVLRLGAASPGAEVRRWISVRVPPSRAGGEVEARVEGLPGEARVEAPVAGTGAGADVYVLVVAPTRAGPFEARVSLRAGGEVVVVPVRGEVVRVASDG